MSHQHPLVVLTGAGISAESGIPTFRGTEGYWTVGSRNYRPEELATYSAFRAQPTEILSWYRHRQDRCRDVEPNAAHHALADLDARLEGFVQLVTQNVDGLHRRAGHASSRMWCIHGDLERCRCANEACPNSVPHDWPNGAIETIRCPRCGDYLRPHVLWFDESYDEARFHIESTLAAIERCAGLLVVGTSGATTLPSMMVERALTRATPVVVVDPEETRFATTANRTAHGVWVQGRATDLVPRVVDLLTLGPNSEPEPPDARRR